ncbi:hypothetical protein AWJ20_277 [Sugiyamaella lignohabitans]|uniref:Uncharacterized protein n=1 Tax=Sugiyamaella lignohabitans TaxID=796027 RepID=A0A167CS65_9ASCO|nr:uncharacterized protein AWJ20_277 [Sugiyamaella lignohabitans]ANB12044.1 hypothetical protein AWJ20_277 [Sugiyamaella lignohabitans]
MPPAAGALPQTPWHLLRRRCWDRQRNDSSAARGATGSGAEPQPPEAQYLRSVTIQTAHGDAEERSTCQESAVGLGESRADFQDNEQKQIGNERPFTAPFITGKTKNEGANRS